MKLQHINSIQMTVEFAWVLYLLAAYFCGPKTRDIMFKFGILEMLSHSQGCNILPQVKIFGRVKWFIAWYLLGAFKLCGKPQLPLRIAYPCFCWFNQIALQIQSSPFFKAAFFGKAAKYFDWRKYEFITHNTFLSPKETWEPEWKKYSIQRQISLCEINCKFYFPNGLQISFFFQTVA